jgi:hypothetical protein
MPILEIIRLSRSFGGLLAADFAVLILISGILTTIGTWVYPKLVQW